MLKTLQAATLVLAVATAPALAGGFDDAQRKEIGDIVRDYLLEHPEILLEVSKKLEEKQQAEETSKREDALKALAGDIFRMKGDHVAGNPEGDVTMVEFFDYNCGWCKKGMPEVLAMLEEDKNLRLVLKEFPIFGGDSDYAAKAALASQKQGKYWEFHVAMLGHEGKVTRETVDKIAAEVGLDVARLKTDMENPEVAEIIRKNQELATALAIGGTPAFVIDNQVVPGYLPKDGLMASVNKVREQGGCKVC
jgi:protein-disulfide isomerase